MERLADVNRADFKRIQLHDFARLVSCLIHHEQGRSAAETFAGRWPRSPHVALLRDHHARVVKALVEPGTTIPPNWAAPLMPSDLGQAFVEFVRPLTIIGRLQDFLRKVPFATAVIRNTQGTTAFAWVTGGKPAPVSHAVWARAVLGPAVASGITVLSRELAQLAEPGAENALVTDLAAGVVTFLDHAFVSPTAAGVPNQHPASITYGVTPVAASTGDALADVRALLGAYVAAGGSLQTAVILLSSANATALALRSGVGNKGDPFFPNLDVTGGRIAGIRAAASDAVGDQLIAFDAARTLFADAGLVDIDRAEEADIEMSDAPTQDGATGTGAAMVSLWQSDLAAVRVRRTINWQAAGAVAVVTGANYLTEG